LLCRGGFIKSIAATCTTQFPPLHSLNNYFPSTFPQLVRHSAICHQNNQSTDSHVERWRCQSSRHHPSLIHFLLRLLHASPYSLAFLIHQKVQRIDTATFLRSYTPHYPTNSTRSFRARRRIQHPTASISAPVHHYRRLPASASTASCIALSKITSQTRGTSPAPYTPSEPFATK
jgi:hypothetical protein